MEGTVHKKRMKTPYFTPERLHLPIMNRVDEEVNKPTKGVLVHGINVCQVCNTEEQHR